MEKTTKEIIKEAIKSETFIDSMVESVGWLDVVKRAYETDNVILLGSIVKSLQRRIIELNIMYWFSRIETVENNILKGLRQGKECKRD